MRKKDEGVERAAMSPGQAAYEERRAAEAGMPLAAWLKRKSRTSPEPRPLIKPPKRKGWLGRLLDRAHRPL